MRALFQGIIILTLWVALPNAIWSQGCCSGGVSVGANMGTAGSDKGQLQIVATYDINTLSTLMTEDSVHEGDNARLRQIQSAIIELDYGVLEWLTITGIFSYIDQFRDVGGDQDQTAGFGDAIIMAKAKVLSLKKGNGSLSVGYGVKLPTGVDNNVDNQGILFSPDLQPGSGTLDNIFWYHFYLPRLFGDHVNILSILNYRQTNTRFDHERWGDYKLGNELQLSVGLTDQFTIGSLLIDPMLLMRYRSVQSDIRNGNDLNGITGGEELHLNPGIGIHPSQRLSLQALASLPVYRRVNGQQLATSWKLTLSANYHFNFSKKQRNKVIEKRL